MSNPIDGKKPANPSAAELRRRREAEALRANLRRRKQQRELREGEQNSPADEDEASPVTSS